MSGVFKLYGIRNHAAKKNISRMRKGDIALWYSSRSGKYVFGIMEVKDKAYQDATTKDTWLAIDFIPVKTFRKSISLKGLTNNEILKKSDIIRQKRISVVSIKPNEYEEIIRIEKVISEKEYNEKHIDNIAKNKTRD